MLCAGVCASTGGDYDVLRRTEPTIYKVLTMTIDSKTVLCPGSAKSQVVGLSTSGGSVGGVWWWILARSI